MNITKLVAILFLSFLVGSTYAGTVNIPPKKPVISIDIPDTWEPEETDKGVACESPDKVATVFFEVAKSEKGMNSIIDENIDWLVKEQGVKIDGSTKQEKELPIGGLSSAMVIYDAASKEFGPSRVGFIFTEISNRLLVTTFWITKKGSEKHDATMSKIFASVKPLK